MDKNLTNIKERVLYFSKRQGITIEFFLNSIDMTYGSFKGEAKKRSLNSDAIEKILMKYPIINPVWLLTGIGEMELSSKTVTTEKEKQQEIIITPLISKYFQKEYISNFTDQNYTKSLNKVPWINDFGVDPKKFKTFEVRGDKMDDNSPQSLLDGDLLLAIEIEKNKWSYLYKSKSNFIILDKEKGIIICRVLSYDIDKKQFNCHYLNELYKDFELNQNDIIAFFKVVELRREPRF